MVDFTINLEVMTTVGAQRNETFRGWHEMQRRDASSVKSNCSKMSRSFEKVGNITSTS